MLKAHSYFLVYIKSYPALFKESSILIKNLLITGINLRMIEPATSNLQRRPLKAIIILISMIG